MALEDVHISCYLSYIVYISFLDVERGARSRFVSVGTVACYTRNNQNWYFTMKVVTSKPPNGVEV